MIWKINIKISLTSVEVIHWSNAISVFTAFIISWWLTLTSFIQLVQICNGRRSVSWIWNIPFIIRCCIFWYSFVALTQTFIHIIFNSDKYIQNIAYKNMIFISYKLDEICVFFKWYGVNIPLFTSTITCTLSSKKIKKKVFYSSCHHQMSQLYCSIIKKGKYYYLT